MIVKMHQAKSQLSKLIAAAIAGEDVLIARGSEPLVRLTPVNPAASKRRFGAYKGEFEISDAFFEPLSEKELAEWEGGKV